MVEWTSVAFQKRHVASDIVTMASTETQAEAKATKELFTRSEMTNDPLDKILAKFTLTKAMRLSA